MKQSKSQAVEWNSRHKLKDINIWVCQGQTTESHQRNPEPKPGIPPGGARELAGCLLTSCDPRFAASSPFDQTRNKNKPRKRTAKVQETYPLMPAWWHALAITEGCLSVRSVPGQRTKCWGSGITTQTIQTAISVRQGQLIERIPQDWTFRFTKRTRSLNVCSESFL